MLAIHSMLWKMDLSIPLSHNLKFLSTTNCMKSAPMIAWRNVIMVENIYGMMKITTAQYTCAYMNTVVREAWGNLHWFRIESFVTPCVKTKLHLLYPYPMKESRYYSLACTISMQCPTMKKSAELDTISRNGLDAVPLETLQNDKMVIMKVKA